MESRLMERTGQQIKIDDPELALAISMLRNIVAPGTHEEHFAAAWLGLQDARRMWKPDKGQSFKSYLFARVRSRCKDQWRELHPRWNSRRPKPDTCYLEELSDDDRFDIGEMPKSDRRLDLGNVDLTRAEELALRMRFEDDLEQSEIGRAIGNYSQGTGKYYLTQAMDKVRAAIAKQ